MPLLKLNTKRPVAEVFGEPGVRWQQDGHYFAADGSLVGEPVEVDEQTVNSDKPPQGSKEEHEWLRQQLAVYNQPFTTPAAARKFLAGKDSS